MLPVRYRAICAVNGVNPWTLGAKVTTVWGNGSLLRPDAFPLQLLLSFRYSITEFRPRCSWWNCRHLIVSAGALERNHPSLSWIFGLEVNAFSCWMTAYLQGVYFTCAWYHLQNHNPTVLYVLNHPIVNLSMSLLICKLLLHPASLCIKFAVLSVRLHHQYFPPIFSHFCPILMFSCISLVITTFVLDAGSLLKYLLGIGAGKSFLKFKPGTCQRNQGTQGLHLQDNNFHPLNLRIRLHSI